MLLESSQRSSGNIVLEIKKWYQQQEQEQQHTGPSSLPIDIRSTVTVQESIKNESTVIVHYELLFPSTSNTTTTSTNSSRIDAVMIEQPIPSGFELYPGLIEELLASTSGSTNSRITHVEINRKGDKPLLSIFYNELGGTQTTSTTTSSPSPSTHLELKFIPKLRGRVRIEGIHVMPMYQPQMATTSQPSFVEI